MNKKKYHYYAASYWQSLSEGWASGPVRHQPAAGSHAVKTTALEKTNLVRTVSTNGTAESTHVEAGQQYDRYSGMGVIDNCRRMAVEKGDRLCRLYDEKAIPGTCRSHDFRQTAINAQNGARPTVFYHWRYQQPACGHKHREADVGTVQPGMKVTIKNRRERRQGIHW